MSDKEFRHVTAFILACILAQWLALFTAIDLTIFMLAYSFWHTAR